MSKTILFSFIILTWNINNILQINNAGFTNTNNKKKKKNYDAIGTVPKSNRQTVETETKSIHIHKCWHSQLGTGTLKNRDVNQVLCPTIGSFYAIKSSQVCLFRSLICIIDKRCLS